MSRLLLLRRLILIICPSNIKLLHVFLYASATSEIVLSNMLRLSNSWESILDSVIVFIISFAQSWRFSYPSKPLPSQGQPNSKSQHTRVNNNWNLTTMGDPLNMKHLQLQRSLIYFYPKISAILVMFQKELERSWNHYFFALRTLLRMHFLGLGWLD